MKKRNRHLRRKRQFYKRVIQGLMVIAVALVVVLIGRVIGLHSNKVTETVTPAMSSEPVKQLEPNPVTYRLELATEAPEYVPSENVELPYFIGVNMSQNCLIVYGVDEEGNYNIPVRAMICSVGADHGDTPAGTLPMTDQYEFHQMVDGTYAQYAYRLGEGHIMIHSVPYYTKDKSDLETDQFNKLGSPASLGCIRVCVRDALWIMENCPWGTQVEIYESDEPEPLEKPEMIKIPENSKNAGWDPTDPDPDNPWKQCRAKIRGAEDITIPAGTAFDPLKGVKATDLCGNDITRDIQLDGTYDCNTPGEYDLRYYVKDVLGNEATKTITITVTR